MLSRRSFLKQLSGLVAAVEVFPRSLCAEDSAVHVPGKEGMIARSIRFLDLEMPMEDLNSWITPAPHFFVRNHMHEPSTLDPSTWALTISGEVENPLTLSLGDHAASPGVSGWRPARPCRRCFPAGAAGPGARDAADNSE